MTFVGTSNYPQDSPFLQSAFSLCLFSHSEDSLQNTCTKFHFILHLKLLSFIDDTVLLHWWVLLWLVDKAHFSFDSWFAIFFCICWIAFLLLQIYSTSQFFHMTDREGPGRFQPQEQIMSVSIVLSRDSCMYVRRHLCIYSVFSLNEGHIMWYSLMSFYSIG